MEPSELLTIISKEYQDILGRNLCGIYVHGSLAFGCFNQNNSDIDFLVIVYNELKQIEKEALILTLFRLNQDAPSKGFEMSVVLYNDCRDFRYPTPFQLHFSNAHIEKIKEDLSEYCRTMNGNDCDLAAHFTVVKKVGIVLYGKPITDVFGEVQKNYYLDSIKADVEDMENQIIINPIYIILNLCRIFAYIKSGLVLSKLEGGNWGMAHLSEKYTDLIQKAVDSYTSDIDFTMDVSIRQQFVRYMKRDIFNE